MVFELAINVEATDLDQLGHVNNVVYLRWVQDVATAHWKSAATQEDQRQLFWVVLRHEIDYKLPARAGDTLTAKTWVGHAAGLKFERHTEFIRSSDGKKVAVARTLWCPIDSSSGRPVQVNAELRARFSTD